MGRIGCVVFVAIIVIFISHHGSRWEVGRLGMPEPIIGPDGRYPDGVVVDPINRAAVASGRYQEVAWSLFLAVVVIFAWMVWEAVQTRRLWREYLDILRRTHELEKGHAKPD